MDLGLSIDKIKCILIKNLFENQPRFNENQTEC